MRIRLSTVFQATIILLAIWLAVAGQRQDDRAREADQRAVQIEGAGEDVREKRAPATGIAYGPSGSWFGGGLAERR